MRQYHVYILASLSRRLYVGVTNDLVRHTYEHKQSAIPGFTHTYRINRLVHFEATSNVNAAIAREKELKELATSTKVPLDRSGQRGMARPQHRLV